MSWSGQHPGLRAQPGLGKSGVPCGRDPAEVQVSGRLPLVAGPDGNPDIARTMDAVMSHVDAGVTAFLGVLPVPDDANAAEDYLTPWVTAFRAATT